MLIHNEYFDIAQIATSGQCFRMNRIEDSKQVKFSLVAYGRYLELTQLSPDTVELNCSVEDFQNIWEDYFDLNFDYGKIITTLIKGEDQFLMEAAVFGRGIRILKQDPFEAAISFIISQNKNIPAIRSCIEGLCRQYGESIRITDTDRVYYSFPKPEVLAHAAKEELRLLKTGYRDEYIIQLAGAVARGELDLVALRRSGFEEAVKALKQVHGVGDKVANCIALYGLHHIDGFPLDVWILRVLKEVYSNKFSIDKYKGYAGIVQQYMFYYYRHLKGVHS